VVQVSCYESGRTRPRAKAVQALAAVLGVDVL
jgi:transcriptional regulator with XRE-family HTH domain